MVARLTFEEKKIILKYYWKHENAVEVQRQFRRMFKKEPPTRVTIPGIKDKFEADGTVENVSKKYSGRPRTSTGSTKEERVLETFHRSLRKSVPQASRGSETAVTKRQKDVVKFFYMLKMKQIIIKNLVCSYLKCIHLFGIPSIYIYTFLLVL